MISRRSLVSAVAALIAVPAASCRRLFGGFGPSPMFLVCNSSLNAGGLQKRTLAEVLETDFENTHYGYYWATVLDSTFDPPKAHHEGRRIYRILVWGSKVEIHTAGVHYDCHPNLNPRHDLIDFVGPLACSD